MQNLRQFANSIRFKLLFGLTVVMLPVVSLLVYINFYAINVVRDQVTQSNQNLLSMYMDQVDQRLEEIEKYLVQIVASDLDLVIFERPQQNENDYNLARVRLFQNFMKESAKRDYVEYMFVYSKENDNLVLTPDRKEEDQYHEGVRKRNEFETVVRNPDTWTGMRFGEWSFLQISDRSYLVFTIETGEVYIGALVNADALSKPLNLIDLGIRGKAFLESGSVQGLSAQARADGYIPVTEISSRGNYKMVVLLHETEVLQNLPLFQRFVTFISYGSIVIFLLALYFIRKSIILPINRLVKAMKRIRSGHLDTRIPDDSTSVEFQTMNTSFNSMVDETQRLKIHIYEEQLAHQQAELRFLKLQINPHFFLNALNTIYYLAQAKQFSLVQEMSMSLIEYFRFVFRSKSEFVSLEEEVKHTDNYLRIQKLRFPNHVTYSIEIAEELKACLIPPLVIQTFAENTIKHAVSLDRTTHIHIGVSSDGSDFYTIDIEDTGKGFPQHVLDRLANPASSEFGEEHIGIMNVKRRLELLYKNKFDIRFYNREGGGAAVNIRLSALRPD